MPVYHSGKLSKTDRPWYNLPLRPSTKDLTVPLAPKNLIVTSSYQVGSWDIRWDNPKIIPQNNSLQITGCNVYRSTDNPYGPYVKCNDTPVTVLFYRDQTKEQQVTEDVSATIQSQTNSGINDPSGLWMVHTQRKPIIMPGTNGKVTNRIEDVRVEIDNGDGIFLDMPAYQINGFTGEITLISWPVYNDELQQIIPPRLPYPPNGRVRVTYKYLEHQVLTVLSQRIYYKVTTVAVDPKDSTKTIETPIEEISERSGFDIEMLDYMMKEMIRRNRWILEQGGERVKLFIRKWMGEKCPDTEHLYGQGHNDCETCFPAGTEITMDDFTRKSIEQIRVGDEVLTHTGRIKKVYEIMSRDIDEEIMEIESIHGIKISPTRNHPILILRKEDAKCIRCKQLNCTGNNRTICNRKPWIKTCNRDTTEYIKWIRADEIKEGDYLISPIPMVEDPIEKFSIDELKIMGYYAAEGHTSKRESKKGGMTKEDKRVIFSFNSNELDTCIKELVESIRNMGYTGTITKLKSNSHQAGVVVTSLSLVKLVLSNIGKYSKNKQLSKKMVWQSISDSLIFLGSYFNGDGCQCSNPKNTSISSSSASYQMARQMQLVLLRCGIISNFIKRTRIIPNPLRSGFHVSTSHELKISKNYMNILARNSFYDECTFNRKTISYINRNFAFFPVKKISRTKFVGKVYNLEVEDDHSYIANGVAVHNCLGTNIVGGYAGPFNIIIAPPESDKMVELMDMGLHIRYEWASWMTDWPLIQTRDIVVRQNNERYSIGPVNPQGMRGTILQQHFTMSLLDQGDIRYQIPITGGETDVPASYDPFRETKPTDASPAINNKPEIPAERIIRGKSVTWENISW